MVDFPLKPTGDGIQPVQPPLRPVFNKERKDSSRSKPSRQREEKAPAPGHQIDEFA
ncbi:MAG: hypothetical protein ACYCYL_06635 [Acidithiobacillus sp.]